MAQSFENVLDFVKTGDMPTLGVTGGVTHVVDLSSNTRETLYLVIGLWLAGKALKVW